MVINPTPALAAAYGLAANDLQRQLMQIVNLDYAVIDDAQEQFARGLDEAGDVHISWLLGRDLRLQVAGRHAMVDTDSMLHGEASSTPLEESAEGGGCD